MSDPNFGPIPGTPRRATAPLAVPRAASTNLEKTSGARVRNIQSGDGRNRRSAFGPFALAARRVRSVAVIAALAAVCAPHLVTAQEGTVKAQHGDWQIVCKEPPPGSKNEVCALVQSVTAEDKD